MPALDVVDVAFSLFIKWSTMSPQEMERLNRVFGYFRDRETEYETGELILPGWATIGDVASQYGIDDGADPFAVPEE